MAVDKDPSIYRDRSSAGNAEELDEYGVWVKSEPQELQTDEVTGGDFIEPSLPDIEDLTDLDLDTETAFAADSLAGDFEAIPVMTEDLSVNDFDISDEIISPVKAEGDDKEITELSMDDFLDETALETFPSPDDSLPEAVEEEAPLVMDLDFQDGLTEDFVTEPETTDFEFEEIEQISPSEEPSPITVESVSEFDDFLNELSGSDAPAQQSAEATIYSSQSQEIPKSPADEMITAEIDIPTDTIDTSVDPVAESADVDLDTSMEAIASFDSDAGLSDLPVFIDDSADEAFGQTPSEQAVPTTPESHVTEPLASPTVHQPSSPVPEDHTDLSTQILLRIADELALIKSEISSLKSELAVLRQIPAPEPVILPSEDKKPAPATGFFEEEDDETIALTGDELDNILNTADFTEESGSDAGDSDELADQEPAVAETDEMLVDRDDILFEESGFENEIPVVTEEDLEDPVAIQEEPAELIRLREDGVSPMTEAPENIDYLEAEAIEEIDLVDDDISTEPELSELVLVDSVLDEPLDEDRIIDPLGDVEIFLEDEGLEEPASDDMEEAMLETLDFDTDVETTMAEDATEELADLSLEASLGQHLETEPAVVDQPCEDKKLSELPSGLQNEVKAVLSYMDQLLESLPDEKIEEFARSEHFETYKKLFEELGLA